ncbi:MAG: hypothetical protein Q8K63_10735, partial [Acidimicrobiales bacterium]|nr:hypothetical protein [Acidimicrobiales bacterium]
GAMTLAVVVLGALAAFVDPSGAADLVRAGVVVPLFVASNLPAEQAVLLTLTVAVLFAVDGLRLRRPELLVAGVVTSHATVVAGALAAGGTLGQAGIAVALASVVWAGLGVVLGSEFDAPLAIGAGAGAAIALSVAVDDPQSFAITLAIVGGLGIAAGVVARINGLAHSGGAAVALAAVLHLQLQSVESIELYLLPVAVHLMIAGEVARRRGPVSSWLSTAPGLLLVSGAALGERLVGGGAEHALIAAVVAGTAVALGGARRQAGPLLSGTAVLAILGGHESFSALVGVPAWGWIGIVGSALIAVAVFIERTDTNPMHLGRRLVDVIGDQFE